ncbi:Protein timeless [Papilio machaon]|uniref:Protein timeless n=1 Tax=Papilio machaon TaxID=76193 RepID=A0A194RC28_PAPMA|nr:Protein timeless [Papilio machaon]
MDRPPKAVEVNKEMRDDEIGKLCEQLAQDGKSKFLNWVQTVLLDTCYAKIYFEKKAQMDTDFTNKDKVMDNTKEPVASPVSYHSLVLNQSVPLVPWNCEQASICKDLKFLQLLHKLGFHMPVDSGKVFIRIPHFWTPDFIFDVASKISPIEKSTLKFSVSEAMECCVTNSNQRNSLALPALTKDTIMTTRLDNFYQVNKQQHFGALVNFTPMPGPSFSLNEEEIQKPNWLEIVQKSQEYKISFDVGSTIVKEEMVEVKVTEVQSKSEQEVREELGRVRMQEAGAEAEEASCSPDTALVIPAAMAATSAISAKPDVKYNLHHMESEYHNSVWETASVASDLTRMYVSDEDEKPEPMPRPRPAPALEVKALCDDLSSSDTPTVEKRPRVTFFPAF